MLRTVRLHRHDAYTVPLCCPIPLTWRIHCPLTRSNNKHDAHTVLLVLKSGWWPITFEIFIKVFPTNWPNSLSRCKNLANSLRCSYSNQAYWLPLKHHILPERWKLGWLILLCYSRCCAACSVLHAIHSNEFTNGTEKNTWKRLVLGETLDADRKKKTFGKL